MAKVLDIEGLDTIPDVLEEFTGSLRSRRRSERTIEAYTEAAKLLDGFLAKRGLPRTLKDVERKHVEEFINDQLNRWKPSTAAVRFRSLQAFWKWVATTDRVVVNPMKEMGPPRVEAPRIEVVSEETMRALLRACRGKTFDDYRDTALFRLFYDSGARMSEIVNLKVADIDMNAHTVLVLGKGARFRVVPFGDDTTKALRYYLRARDTHLLKDTEWLWLGARGQQLTRSGVDQLLRRRCREADIPELHAHQFRHTAAHHLQRAGVADGALMSMFGWKSREMLNRYGAALAEERAIEAYRVAGAPGDRL